MSRCQQTAIILSTLIVHRRSCLSNWKDTCDTARRAARPRHSVIRRQLPITAAYACTDYRAQGQTILAVVVDIGSPPTRGLSLFNLYVALSRSQGRETISLLREFNEKYFKVAEVHEL
ncbi:hypothetical protein PAXRUDRAFT_835436 [Paxillus rubicundulus Ve08.2h10]|uniref:Unplaced genomic scaffold scaffold_2817, whole genome shotgun sequence n=1 Tax=Paxillus rubicundulus Ve08.2h10 TaxID=930991 RepID=A0A0D0D7D2_9AGAM|nr:hypothetical protein PAXRUDRAFT_835436 [Paxillus rubicundulus Ve08.2h10]